MSNSLIICSVLFCFNFKLEAQQYIGSNNTLKLKDIIKREKKLGSINKPTRKSLNKEFEIAEFIRIKDDFHPKPLVEYFYNKNDSIVYKIIIDFDSLNFIKEDLSKRMAYTEVDSRINDYLNKYEKIKSEITQKLGVAGKSNKLELASEITDLYYWNRSDQWINDSININLSLVFSDNKTSTGSYRISLLIFLKNKKAKSLNISLKKHEQDSISQEFLQKIFEHNYSASFAYLDDKLKSNISYDSYIIEAKKINELAKEYGKEISLFRGSVKETKSGKSRIIYTYTFSSDKNEPKTILLNIGFESINQQKIIEILPQKVIK